MLVQELHHMNRFLFFGVNRGIIVHPLEHETSQFRVSRLDLVAVADVPVEGVNHRHNKRGNTTALAVPQDSHGVVGQVRHFQNPAVNRVLDVVVYVGDFVRESHHIPLPSRRFGFTGVIANPVTHLHCQIQPDSVFLDYLDHPNTLLGVAKSETSVQDSLAVVPERRVPQVVTQRDCFGQVLVESQSPSDCSGNLCHLEGVSEPRPVMVGLREQKHLCLVFEPPERTRVDNPVAVTLEVRANVAGRLGKIPLPEIAAFAGVFREHGTLVFDCAFPNNHVLPPLRNCARRLSTEIYA
jgi:hypothetical protein